jgi:hypothetical protein
VTSSIGRPRTCRPDAKKVLTATEAWTPPKTSAAADGLSSLVPSADEAGGLLRLAGAGESADDGTVRAEVGDELPGQFEG